MRPAPALALAYSVPSLALSATTDPYTHRPGEQRTPPVGFRSRLRHLGPGIVISGTIVGSGEILLTSSLGAQAGFLLLWWVLLSCWSKSIVQAELARYIIISGDTYLRALNRLPGRSATRHGGIAWPIPLGLLGFIPSLLTMGGIVGGASQGLQLLIGFDPVTNTAIVALAVMAVLGTGAYLRFERSMIALVMSFTVITLVCAITMQFSDYAVSLPDVASGLRFDFPVEFAVLALAMYGYTGVNSSESAAYTYWCIEKGWPSHIGADRSDPGWLDRARGWIRVLHTDVWTTLILLTLATLPFYMLGAGVLHRSGATPSGLDTIRTLSAMFTDVLGGWSLWLFGCGAFFIFFSTALSGIAAGGRFVPDYLIELGLLDRHRVNRRHWIRGYVLIVPVTSFILYLTFESPVLLVTIGAVTAALFLPLQSGATLWLQSRFLDPRVRPGTLAKGTLWTVFVFQLAMAAAVIWFVIL